MVMCILSFIFLIGSLRTNLVFVLIFIFATIGFGLGAGAFFHLAQATLLLGYDWQKDWELASLPPVYWASTSY
jgi:hypothetical protein